MGVTSHISDSASTEANGDLGGLYAIPQRSFTEWCPLATHNYGMDAWRLTWAGTRLFHEDSAGVTKQTLHFHFFFGAKRSGRHYMHQNPRLFFNDIN